MTSNNLLRFKQNKSVPQKRGTLYFERKTFSSHCLE
nr:MAG TPA: hypothetical protein [Caudoviricetes sp.]